MPIGSEHYGNPSSYVIFQRLKVPFTTLAMNAFRIQAYFEKNKKEKAWWSGTAHRGPKPLTMKDKDKDKAKAK